MVASIGVVASASQGVSYYERDGYYASDDPMHREASTWTGKGAEALDLSGPVDPGTFAEVLEGHVPDGSGHRLGKRTKNGGIHHRPGRDLTLSAPKSVSLAALVGDDLRVVKAHDKAVRRTLDWVEKNVIQTRVMDPETKQMIRVQGQKMVAASFRHDTSRNLDPQLHTHAVIANMVKGEDGKWRTIANEKLYRSKMLIGAIYRNDLAAGLKTLGYGIRKTHADGRFEIEGVSRDVIESFSTRRTAIEAAMRERGLGKTGDNPILAARAALMTRAHKRDVDREALGQTWKDQAADLGFNATALTAQARGRCAERMQAEQTRAGPLRAGHDQMAFDFGAEERSGKSPEIGGTRRLSMAERAVGWAVDHLSEREAVFTRTALLGAALSWRPGAVSIEDAERMVESLTKDGVLHATDFPVKGDSLTTDRAIADEKETLSLMSRSRGKSRPVMRNWRIVPLLHRGRLTFGQKEAVKLILSSKDRVVGVQGYAGTGKTTMLDRARGLAAKNGYRMMGLAPSASAAKTLGQEAGIESETLQRFLARNAGVAAGRLTAKGEKQMRGQFGKTVLVVDEGSLASTVQARDLLRIANKLQIPRVILVGDEKQLDAVDAGKPFSQLQRGGMKTAVLDEIMRQKDAELKEAVRASLSGDVKTAFEKLGDRVAEVEPDNLAGAAAARWLKLSDRERERTGLMAPSHELRRLINGYIRERLARDGKIHGPSLQGERLVSYGYTKAEKSLAGNYSPGDVVAFHRAYKTLGVEKGDERQVVDVEQRFGKVLLEQPDGAARSRGAAVEWRPRRVAGKRGAVEVFRREAIELRAGDVVRWTRNDASLNLVNSHTAEVTEVKGHDVTFKLEDGRSLTLSEGDAQLRHLDYAWASTVHAFQGRTVDNVIAVMEAKHPHLSTQKSFYVEISRARHRAELVTDDAGALREHLETASGERVSALEGIAAAPDRSPERSVDREHVDIDLSEPVWARAPETPDKSDHKTGLEEPQPAPEREKTPEPMEIDYGLEL